MYEIAADFDPQIFVGRRFTSVTFAENVIHVHFDDELSVTVLDSIIYRTGTQAEEVVESPPFVDSPPLSSTSLVSLIGQEVTSGKVETSYELVLGFEGGGSMRFVDPMEGVRVIHHHNRRYRDHRLSALPCPTSAAISGRQLRSRGTSSAMRESSVRLGRISRCASARRSASPPPTDNGDRLVQRGIKVEVVGRCHATEPVGIDIHHVSRPPR